MHEDGVTARSQPARRRQWREIAGRIADRLVLRRLQAVLQPSCTGCLHLVLPSGEVAVLGRHGAAPRARLTINRYRGLWKLLRGGSLGFAESYMDGDVDTTDLVAVFEFYFENAEALTSAIPSIDVTSGRDRVWHAGRSNTRTGSRRNIAAHYDLGNDFYRLWLDPSLLYSSGIYRSADDTLETAQQTKLAQILSALELGPRQTLLEIGCGWGALAEAAAAPGPPCGPSRSRRSSSKSRAVALQPQGSTTASRFCSRITATRPAHSTVWCRSR